MARLTKPQARIIGGNKPGEKLFSNPRINTNQRSIDTLVKHGHLRVTDRQPGGFTEYTVQDTPEVRACNAERDAAYAAIMAEPAAIAQPVSVATDAAPAYKAARGAFEWHEGDEPAEVSIRRLRDSAPDAAQTAAADAEPRVCDCGNDRVIPGTELCEDCRWAGQMYPHLFPEDHAQPAPDAVSETVTFAEYQDKRREIYELTHERDYLQREYDAISQAFDGYMKANAEREDREEALTRELEAAKAEASARIDRMERQGAIALQISDERLGTLMEDTDKLIDGLDNISPMEALTRLLAFRRVYAAFTQELHRAEAQTDAAPMIAALRKRDNGHRTTADNVLAMFEDGDEGTIA